MNASFAPQIAAARARSFADQLSLRSLLFMACGVKICEMGNSVLLGRPEVKLGVSWTHRDDMTPEETLRFARWMQLAADVAERFVYNGYRVVDEEEGA